MSSSDGLVLTVRGGARLCVPATLDRITPYVLLEQEDWFEDEIRFVRRWLRPGMNAIDIGASFGAYTVAIARAVGSAGRVWAYEPATSAADLLERSLALNGCASAEVIRAAVGETQGRIAFVQSEHSEISSVAGESAPQGELREVPAVTLDHEAAGRGWRNIDFVKIDIEGHEHAAIRGGAEFLRRASPLVMFEIAHRGAFDLRGVEVLAELGYRVFRLLPGPLVLVPFDTVAPPDRFQLNLFACKDDRAGALAAEGFLVREVPSSTVGPAHSAWTGFASAAPYARELAPHWPAAPGWFAAEDRKLYLRGLAAFAQSADPGTPADLGVALLTEALACVARALQDRETPARRLSYARLAWALGLRQAAAQALAGAGDAIDASTARAEPFLAPSERYERTAGADSVDWLRCAASEQYERLRAFSSFYTGTEALELLEPIRALPFRSPEVDRRRNLVRLRAGKLKAAEPSALLASASEENLNPQCWTAGR